MTDIINNDDHPDDEGLHADQEDHWGTVNAASTSDAATGLAQARENRKLSNTSLGNNMIRTRSTGGIMGEAQRQSSKASLYN